MSDDFEIPAFLRRTPIGEQQMTTHTQTPAPAKPAKRKRANAYVARLTLYIPLDMADADSLAGAIKAVAGIKESLPAGSTVETTRASFGKMA